MNLAFGLPQIGALIGIAGAVLAIQSNPQAMAIARGRHIGCLGDISFEISYSTVLTLDNLVWSGSARYGTHQRHMGNALTEFTGVDPDKITFDILLSADLGVNPMQEATKIWAAERTGTPVSLTVGSKVYGKHKWTIQKHDMKMTSYDKAGDVTCMMVSVELLEYLKR